MNAVTVPSDTRVRARLDRELSQERGGPKVGAASGVRRIERHQRVPNQVWRTTISADEPAGSVYGPAGGRTERMQAGADPSAQRIHRENWSGKYRGSVESRPMPYWPLMSPTGAQRRPPRGQSHATLAHECRPPSHASPSRSCPHGSRRPQQAPRRTDRNAALGAMLQ